MAGLPWRVNCTSPAAAREGIGAIRVRASRRSTLRDMIWKSYLFFVQQVRETANSGTRMSGLLAFSNRRTEGAISSSMCRMAYGGWEGSGGPGWPMDRKYLMNRGLAK